MEKTKKDKIIEAIRNNDRSALYEAYTGESAWPEINVLIGENEAITSIEYNENGEPAPVYNEKGRCWKKDGTLTTLGEVGKLKPELIWMDIVDSEVK